MTLLLSEEDWLTVTEAATPQPSRPARSAPRPLRLRSRHLPPSHGSVASDDLPTPEDCRSALKRVTASVVFQASPRLAAFLCFVTDAALSGEAASIKAYTVAVGALGRPHDFDPATDAIVRVEAGRLRAALARYYDGPGSNEALVIAMPRGGYVPRFRWRRIGKRSTGRPAADGSPSRSFGVYVEHATAVVEYRRNQALLRDNLRALSTHIQDLRLHIRRLRAKST